MRTPCLAALIVLSACSSAGVDNRSVTPADVSSAAAAGQDDIDRYAAGSSGTRLASAPTATASPATPSPAPAAPLPAATEAGAGEAVAVIQAYYAAIAARRFDEAYRLWGDGGRASGMSPRQFADSFVRYAEYDAVVGPPGEIEAGAGQRYITIPVRVTGTLADGGRPFSLQGKLTLHRTADIDGASAEQRSWRISDSALRPRPDAALPEPEPR